MSLARNLVSKGQQLVRDPRLPTFVLTTIFGLTRERLGD